MDIPDAVSPETPRLDVVFFAKNRGLVNGGEGCESCRRPGRRQGLVGVYTSHPGQLGGAQPLVFASQCSPVIFFVRRSSRPWTSAAASRAQLGNRVAPSTAKAHQCHA